MHGIIFNELRKYATARLGPGAWEMLLTSADLGGKTYLATQRYPDEEVVALVGAASAAASLDASVVLEDFGEFIAPDLIGMFRSLIRPEWRTLDVVARTEDTIHKVVRLRYADAAPPYLKATRIAANHVQIIYTSPRKLCFIAKGIVKGLAKHFNEEIRLDEPECMILGGRECRMEVMS